MQKRKNTLLIVNMSFLVLIGTFIFSSCADKDEPSPVPPHTGRHSLHIKIL